MGIEEEEEDLMPLKVAAAEATQEAEVMWQCKQIQPLDPTIV